jgi:Ribbon-helix-helix domain
MVDPDATLGCHDLSTPVLSRMTPSKHGNREKLMGYYSPEAVAQLKRLSEITRVPQAVYMREALDDLLKKYAATLRKAAK